MHVKTAPAPIPPPPTIIRFGDVGVAPSGCPMCPVLDEEATKKQQEMKLKDTMYLKIFAMKEALQNSDQTVEQTMLQHENSTGPVGPEGPEGYQGSAGANGARGSEGAPGVQGFQGPEGYYGLSVPRAPRGKRAGTDWYKLAQEFNDGAVGEINRGDAGGRCHNHVAVTSFSGGEKASVWVNERTFNFSPTYAGSTCKLYSAERTMAVYACTV
ncbi:hypothetical protein T484DRAFT_3142856 [Baffinella frigidus]|nr:hypothetical protein T484DRAFT_3142856 [Cryptophyta sp. CCMP2293]